MKIYVWTVVFFISLFAYTQMQGIYITHLLLGKATWARSGPSALNHK